MTQSSTDVRLEFSRSFLSLRTWLFEQALPFWSTVGVDPLGGFVERTMPDGQPTDEPRRARLVARQVYSFAVARGLGWAGNADDLVAHGLASLETRFLRADGTVASTTTPDGRLLDGRFDLYDHAFALFGLAAAAHDPKLRPRLASRARTILQAIRQGWSHPVRGFEESNPRTLPLKANPHMHMLEATLAWSEVDDHPCWAETADEIASLCLESFIRSEDGALLEYFDGDWKAFESDASNVIEPGHQFEWSWLLLRWGTLRNRQDAVAAASRMLTFGEAHGVDRRRGLAVNELGLDHRVRDDRARLWPQTERLKANCIAAMMSTRESDRDDFLCRSAESIRGILRYTAHPTAGAWWEHIDAGGTALVEPTRASSLYHITCAIEQASRAHATLC